MKTALFKRRNEVQQPKDLTTYQKDYIVAEASRRGRADKINKVLRMQSYA